ncbi:MAG: PTS sugar transporter subunit IIA [Gammaproteobacteria bacterium]|nr:PTS sugar transporter subunit IIA [Gammaproteobacteria bacterium]
MSVSILIISHAKIGEAFLQTATDILGGSLPLNVRLLPAEMGCDPDKICSDAEAIIDEIDDGSGVLILTDIFGATPSNIANTVLSHRDVCVITGLNLPMLIRTLNYPHLSIDELCDKALKGGSEGIMHCEKNH